jgi:hypothetical protein
MAMAMAMETTTVINMVAAFLFFSGFLSYLGKKERRFSEGPYG